MIQDPAGSARFWILLDPHARFRILLDQLDSGSYLIRTIQVPAAFARFRILLDPLDS